MPIQTIIRKSFYRDSLILMRLAEALRAQPGVRDAAILMGTAANRELLIEAKLATAAAGEAAADDLVITVSADDDAAAGRALAHAASLLDADQQTDASSGFRPHSLEAALRGQADANLAVISVPGAHARAEAMRALRRGLHVLLFSDNVSLVDELELKRYATARGLFCMGPDCGTAYVAGIGIGFANVVRRGRIGCVAASGTGLQAVAARLDALGEGVSHGIGVGGRELSAEIGGAMTRFALAALAADAATEAIVLISKPPAADALPGLIETLKEIKKPLVVCCLGAAKPAGGTPGFWVETLADAADAVVALLRGQPWTACAFADPAAISARLAALALDERPRGASILGLYTGGTLAHEAHLLLAPMLGEIGEDLAGTRHRVVDLGDDQFTRGHPHPMLAPEMRADLIRQHASAPEVGVLLLDLVLGRGAHADPARTLAAAVAHARQAAQAAGRALVVVASIIGTERDPQDIDGQAALLRAAGVEVLPSNAEAARFAARVINPTLAQARA